MYCFTKSLYTCIGLTLPHGTTERLKAMNAPPGAVAVDQSNKTAPSQTSQSNLFAPSEK